MNEKQGFTLIELLAVIVILAVIALIATPLVLNMIEKAEKGAFKDSVYGIMEAAEFQVTLDDSKYPITYVFPEDNGRIKFKGTKPTEGYIQIVNEGKMKLALGNGRWCAVKDVSDSQVTIQNGHCGKSNLALPVINGYGELIQEIYLNETYTMPVVTATDKDGNKINVITVIKQGDQVVDSIDTSKIGIYTITYTTEPDKEGNTGSVAVTLKVIQKETDIDKVIESGITDGELEFIDETYYYRGANPNNYVEFDGVLWRIISIEDGNMKLIRNESIGNMKWDTKDSKGNNNWSRPADIKTYLNSTFYNSISSVNRSKMQSVTWNIGKIAWNETNATPAGIKTTEKGRKWTGYVGLMNASDYVYTTTDSSCTTKAMNNANCKDNNWLYDSTSHQWTINGNSTYSYLVFHVTSDGRLNCYNRNANYSLAVRPVIFLSSSVSITSGGQGTTDNPYVIG